MIFIMYLSRPPLRGKWDIAERIMGRREGEKYEKRIEERYTINLSLFLVIWQKQKDRDMIEKFLTKTVFSLKY